MRLASSVASTFMLSNKSAIIASLADVWGKSCGLPVGVGGNSFVPGFKVLSKSLFDLLMIAL
ncbi:MAG TPA: hypothetical protein DCW29_19860 [Janthinobacterium sp.]|nr:hypothetical protein [Janthinobacterium sp.]